jgi:hypothetical protein
MALFGIFPDRWKRVMSAGAASLLCAAALSGCQAVQGSATSIAQLRIIDASPNAGGLDIYAGNTAIAYNMGFGTVTSYVPMSPSTYALTAAAAGTKTASTAVRATLANARQYTLLLSNTAASLQSQVLADQSQPAPSGQIALRFLNEATSAGPLDLYLVPQGNTLPQVNAIQTALNFGGNSGYLNAPTGTYTLYVVGNGTVVSTTTVPLYTGAATAYPAGSARTFILLDQALVTTTPVQVVVASDYDSPTATQ